MPHPNVDIFVRNVARRWKSAIDRQEEQHVLVFSPYVTSKTAENVLESLNPKECSIYTVFSIENFAQGSSSLTTIKKLSDRGFAIFHLPQLHAKAIITANTFASIGSQNLTAQGTRNREATAVFTEEYEVVRIRKMFEKWIPFGVLVSSDMICQAEQIVAPLRKMFKAAQVEARTAEQELFNKEQKRIEAEKLRAVEAENERLEKQRLAEKAKYDQLQREQILVVQKRRLEDLERLIGSSNRLTEELIGSVKGKIFTPRGHRSFIEWNSTGRKIELHRAHRYLCILPESGKISWVRVMRGRLSFVERGMAPKETFAIGGVGYYITISAMWDRELTEGYNLQIKFGYHAGKMLLSCKLWFDLNKLVYVSHTNEGFAPQDVVNVLSQIMFEESLFRQKLFDRMFNPFKYAEKLVGSSAALFFGAGAYKVSLRELSPMRRLLVGMRLA